MNTAADIAAALRSVPEGRWFTLSPSPGRFREDNLPLGAADALDALLGEVARLEAREQQLRDRQRLHHTLLQGAWDELEAAEAHHRWHHEHEGREVEPREERVALLIDLAGALDDEDASPYASASDVLAATLQFLAQHHHDTIEGSRKHDAEHVASFTDCVCLTCRKAAAALRLADRARAAPTAEQEDDRQ